ncbi:MAG TPA: type II toxin-antitoxin system prevent-host-death family antitoxin [Rhizomicrobium sp.]
MEKTVGAFEAKTHFSELLDRAERGEEILITKRGKAVARLMPISANGDDGVAVKALARMRKRAKTTGIKRFDWNEWKKYVEEGRH